MSTLRGLALRRRNLLLLMACGSTVLTGCGGGDDAPPPVQADPRLVPFWQNYFSLKSAHDANIADLFADSFVYEDNTLRLRMTGSRAFIRTQWQGLFSILPVGPQARYRSATGTMEGCGVEFANDAGFLLSAPTEALCVVDLRGGLISRITDYWDSAQVSEAEFNGLRAGFASNPAWTTADTGAPSGANQATPGLVTILQRYAAACAAGDATAAVACLSPQCSYAHRPLGLAMQGQTAIGNLFRAALALLPDGAGMQLTHVVGNELGGAFEWLASGTSAVLRGGTQIELTNGLISRINVYYDSRLLPPARQQLISSVIT